MASIQGTTGNDILSGTSGPDDISDFAGNDQVNAGAGDDLLFAGLGDDTFDGGPGTDTIFIPSYSQSNALTTVNLANGTISGPDVGNDTVTNVEIWQGHGAGNFNFIGSNGNDIIFADSFGKNTVSGGAGDDSISDFGTVSVLDGGSGHNALMLGRSTYFNGHSTVDNFTSFTLSFTPGVSGALPDGTTYSNFDWYNIETGRGDDTVTFNHLIQRPSPGPYYSNWWKAGGGFDTAIIDLSNYTTQLSMNAQSWGGITITDTGTTGNGPPPNPTHVISLESVEVAIVSGGSALDILMGGDEVDVFTGNGGDDLLDGGGGANMARYSGLSGNYRVDKLSANSYKVTDLRSGSPDGADTLVNIQRLQWGDGSVTTLANSPPIVMTHDALQGRGLTLALSGLFSVNDVDGNAITQYQLWDGTRDASSGHFEINGVAQAAGTVITISAAQLAQTTFVTGAGDDSLQIRAYDGNNWSATDTAAWAPFTISSGNNVPVLNTTPFQRVAAGQTLALSSLFTVSDADGDTMTRYQLWDSTADSNSGHWIVNGQAKAAGTIIDVTAAQLAQTSFVTGTVNDNLQIRAFDGTSWSASDNAPWSPFTIGPTANNPPLVQTSNRTIARGLATSLASLISVVDIDGDSMTKYQLWDSTADPLSGHWVVGGVTKSAGTIIDVTAAQLGQTSFVTGAVGDSLQIRANDGFAWSAPDNGSWAPFTVTVPDAAPVVTTGNVSKTHFQSYALSGLFSVNDTDGDTMTRYQLWDSTRDPNSGHFEINGVAQSAGTVIDITAAQLPQTTFVTGSVNDDLQIRAFDGISWSAADNASWATFTVSVPAYTAPHVTTGPVNASIGQTIALSSLMLVTDMDGDSMTRYQLWDSTANPLSGHWVVGGQAQAAGTVIDITAAQFNQTSFVAGRVNDNLQVRAFDGRSWSDADNAAWAPFTVTVPANHAPVLTTTPQLAMHNRLMPLSGLFSVSDADSDSMTRYQLWDSSRDPNSGHWQVNGVAQAAGTVIDVTAAQLAQTFFVSGISASDSLQIRAFDGMDWSDGDNASWAPFTVTVATPYTAPSVNTNDVNTTAAQTLALSSLMSVSDPDGDSMTRYQLWDSTGDPNSGHWVVGGVAKSASTVIDITAAQFGQTSFVTGTLGDSLQIRAFDGLSWSAADNASWSPFHINVS